MNLARMLYANPYGEMDKTTAALLELREAQAELRAASEELAVPVFTGDLDHLLARIKAADERREAAIERLCA